jgi:hypothetical protein
MDRLTEEKITELEEEGYRMLHMVEGKGICGISSQFIFTVSLVVGITEIGYDHRYCYPTNQSSSAMIGYMEWLTGNITEHPTDSDWIKRKGAGEMSNPNYKKQ